MPPFGKPYSFFLLCGVGEHPYDDGDKRSDHEYAEDKVDRAPDYSADELDRPRNDGDNDSRKQNGDNYLFLIPFLLLFPFSLFP